MNIAPPNDEIDLRPYLSTLTSNWRLIGLLTLIFAVVTLVYFLTRPRVYEASANLLLTRSRATLSLAEQFPTIIEPPDARSRVDAIMAITSSDAIAEKVFDQIVGQLPTEGRNLAAFKNQIEVISRGDVIQISASAKNPNLAEAIANLWAVEATQAVNLAFSGEQPLGEIELQLEEARKEFQLALTNLETFLDRSQIARLNSQITELETLYEGVTGGRLQRIQVLIARRQLLEEQRLQIELLHAQINRGASSNAGDVGDALGVLSARIIPLSVVSPPVQALTNTISGSRSFHLTIQLPINEAEALRDTRDNYSADVETIIFQIEEDLKRIDGELTHMAEESVVSGSDELSQITLQAINNLQSQLERERSKLLELSSERELTWTAYQALAQKVVEIENAARTENVVSLANLAVAPDEAQPRGTLFSTLIAAGLGFFIGVFWTFATQWWQTMDMHTTGMDNSQQR